MVAVLVLRLGPTNLTGYFSVGLFWTNIRLSKILDSFWPKLWAGVGAWFLVGTQNWSSLEFQLTHGALLAACCFLLFPLVDFVSRENHLAQWQLSCEEAKLWDHCLSVKSMQGFCRWTVMTEPVLPCVLSCFSKSACPWWATLPSNAKLNLYQIYLCERFSRSCPSE